MRSLQGFDIAIRRLSGLLGERSLRLVTLASAVRVGPTQFPGVHAAVQDAAAVLDLDPVPEVYVRSDPFVQASTVGMDRPFVVLSTRTVELMDPDELRFVVGHELGHVASGHAVYGTMLYAVTALALRLSWLPIGVLGLRAIIAALEEWGRKAELSCDRAGLLVVQDPAVALQALMKLAGGAHLSEMNVNAFLEQAREHDAAADLRESVLKLLAVQGQSHPFAAPRAAQLQRWAVGGEYAAVLAGDYARREDDPNTSIGAEVRSATRSYADSLRSSADPLAGLVRGVAGNAAAAGQRLWERAGMARPQTPPATAPDAPDQPPAGPGTGTPPAGPGTGTSPSTPGTGTPPAAPNGSPVWGTPPD